MNNAEFAAVRNAADRCAWLEVIDLTSGHTNHSDISAIWCGAMTAHFGPTGTHAGYLDANGVPTDETLATFPDMRIRMLNAQRKVENGIERFEYFARR